MEGENGGGCGGVRAACMCLVVWGKGSALIYLNKIVYVTVMFIVSFRGGKRRKG